MAAPFSARRRPDNYLALARSAFQRSAGSRRRMLLAAGLWPDWRQECILAAIECERGQMCCKAAWKHCLAQAFAALHRMGWWKPRHGDYRRDVQFPTRIAGFLIGFRKAPVGRRTALVIS